MPDFLSDLDAPLLRISPRPGDVLRLRQACAGIHVFGQIGSGKSSGSGAMLAGAYLRAGFGGIVTCVKPEEVPTWAKRYAPQHRREPSIVLFDENEGCNFLDYELAKQGFEGIGSVVECFMRILEAAKKAGVSSEQSGGGGDKDFWDASTRMILRYAIAPLYAAFGSVSIADIIRLISAAPRTFEDVTSPEWRNRSVLFKTIDAACNRPAKRMSAAGMQNTLDFWTQRYVGIPDKTRGNIVITVTAILDRFLHGRLNKAFCGKTTVIPEMTFGGAVILLAMPTLTWFEDGIIAQQLFKYLWQRAVLSRNSLEEKYRERPVFMFSDENQETCSTYDETFIGLSRSSKTILTCLSQSLPSYYAKLGQHAAESLVGKFTTHILHANADPCTNDFASRMLGKIPMRHYNYSVGTGRNWNEGMNVGGGTNRGTSFNYSRGGSHSSQGGSSANSSIGYGSSSGSSETWGNTRGRGGSANESRGYSESMEYAIEPGDFARILKNGGPQNEGIVTGVWFESARVFEETGTNTLIATFKQQ